ncbi:hypothetical protein C8F01DRAFT_1372978 [Mycena amicta]|nr:hypothetical protein C8F01DRAFT_1372978 [Mycena amicta]
MFLTDFFTAPGADLITISKLSLPADPLLPAGALQYVQNAERTEPFRASLLGRIVGIVQWPREKYLILEAVDHQPLQRDFKAFIHALEVITARYRGLFSKRVNYWCQRGRDESPGLVSVHLTSQTKLTKYAWDIDWLDSLPPTADTTKLQVGAVVFCMGHLLRIQRPEFVGNVGNEHMVSELHYIIKSASVTCIHRPTVYDCEEDPDVARFLSTGLLPGAVPKQDEI